MLFAAEEISLKVDGVPFDLDAIRAEERRLRVYAAEGERGSQPPFPVHDAVAGYDAGAGVHVQGVPYRAGSARRAAHSGDLPVGRDFARRHAADGFINFIVKTHLFIPSTLSAFAWKIISFSSAVKE